MAQSRTNKKRKHKVQQFKNNQKKMEKQASIPKTHLVPQPEWQSNENLDMRGDILEALEQQIMIGLDALQKSGQALQYLMAQNIKSGKINLSYVWNNGEPATEQEIAAYKEQLEKVKAERNQQMLAQQEELQKQANAARTGLVGPDGQPIGTTQSLEEDTDEEALPDTPSLIVTDDASPVQSESEVSEG
jgi:hypothetical protein